MAGFDPKAYAASDDSAPAFDPKAYAAAEEIEPNFFTNAGRAVMSGLAKLDSYTGAPVRAAILARQNATADPNNVPITAGIPEAAKAFAAQFGQDPSRAPTGQDIVENAGAPKGSTVAKALGFGMDVISNPTTYVPIGEMIGAGVKGAGAALGMGSKASEAAADAAPISSAVIPSGDAPVTSAASAPGITSRAAGKVAEAMTGVNDKLASNYLSNTDRINQIMKDYVAPDGTYLEANHANDIRDSWRNIIQDTRGKMNAQISSQLDNPQSSVPSISAKSVQDSLQSSLDKAHPVTQAPDRTQIEGLMDVLGQMTDENGNISPKDLHAFKMYAQKAAAPTYDGVGNAIFPQGDFAAKAANNAAGSARNLLIKEGPSQVAKAESVLSDLHGAEDTMNSTLLKDNGAVAGMSRAGVNSGGVEANSLNQLSDAVNKANQTIGAKAPPADFLQDAKDFATVRQFADPKLTPDFNGKSIFRLLLGGVAGKALDMTGLPPEIAYPAGLAMTSPAALKVGTNAINMAGNVATAPFRAAAAAPGAIYSAATSPAGRAAIDLGAKGMMAAPAVAQGGSQIPLPASVAQSQQPNRSPARGPAAWMQDGLSKLGIQDPQMQQKLLGDPQAQQLLLHAHGVAPNSKAMKSIQSQIQKGWGTR